MTLVFYRKWRPQTLAEVAGQEPVTRTLLNALRQNRLAHAYLFTGPRGTGKTSTGRILAKAVNCLTTGGQDEPCNACDSCEAFNESRALDLIEIDAASNRGIDEIRELRERVHYHPAVARRKVYILDEVHMLTDAAFNALLKTLEEPPPHVLFVLATTEVHRVPATIASRCQRFDFRRIPLEAIVQRLSQISEQEDLSVPDEGLRLIAHAATGSLRDAQNLLEQAVTVFGSSPSLEEVRALLGLTGDARVRQLTNQVVSRDLAGALGTLQTVQGDGLDLRQFQRELVEWLRALLLVKAGASQVSHLPAEDLAELRALARQISLEEVGRSLQLFASADLRTDAYSPLPLEIALVETLAFERPPTTPSDRVSDSDARLGSFPGRRPSQGDLPSARANLTVQQAPPTSRGAAQVRPPVPSRELPPNLTAPSAPQSTVMNPTPHPADTPAQRLDALRRSFLAEVRQRDPKAAALLNSKWQPEDDGDGALILVFPYEFHKKELEASSQHLRAVEDATRAVLGSRFRIRCSVVPQPAGAPSAGESIAGASAASTEPYDNPVVRAALEEGARLLDLP